METQQLAMFQVLGKQDWSRYCKNVMLTIYGAKCEHSWSKSFFQDPSSNLLLKMSLTDIEKR